MLILGNFETYFQIRNFLFCTKTFVLCDPINQLLPYFFRHWSPIQKFAEVDSLLKRDESSKDGSVSKGMGHHGLDPSEVSETQMMNAEN